jgi:hypothetical protein
MNEAAFLAEQAQSLRTAQSGGITVNAVITGMRLDDGSYHVLSCYGDDIWVLPDSLFSAGVKDHSKKLNFARVPDIFQDTLRKCMARHILAGIEGRPRPRGGTVWQFFNNVALFLVWLHERGVMRLSDVSPLITMQYVDYCKGLNGLKGERSSPSNLRQRLSAVETLHILSQQTHDSMRHPWPESSAQHLAGQTGQGNPRHQEAKTEVIPDDILGPLFQSAVEWLDQADDIMGLITQVQAWQAEGRSGAFIAPRLKKQGWTGRTLRAAELHLQTACMCIILITSGIRVSELCSLETQSAFTTLDDDGEPFYWMRGTSYKTGMGACDWLVTEVTHRALAVAARLAHPLQERLTQRIAELHSSNSRDPEIARLNHHTNRLFLSVSNTKNNRIATISRNQVKERLNEFAVQYGLDWHFAPHQFRRTFAVYAAHSAFGDLRYLRHHFKHWSLDMTILYAMNRQQDAELYDEVGLAALGLKTDILEHWLEPDAILTGGGAEPIRVFRDKFEAPVTKESRAEMAKTINPLVHLRATGVAWCTADTGGCNGGQGAEKTRCGDCCNAVIDASRAPVWRAIYAQQLELRHLPDLGPGGMERVERDINRCEMVLKALGATEEDLADVATR